MNKQDFKHNYPEKYLKDVYVYECEQYLLTIGDDLFDEDTIKYAEGITNQYLKNKNEILDQMLDLGLRDFYKDSYDYTDELIKENLGKPQISIFKKNQGNENWKFKYMGAITFLESRLDEHIIEIEFIDDLQFKKRVGIDG